MHLLFGLIGFIPRMQFLGNVEIPDHNGPTDSVLRRADDGVGQLPRELGCDAAARTVQARQDGRLHHPSAGLRRVHQVRPAVPAGPRGTTGVPRGRCRGADALLQVSQSGECSTWKN